MPFIPLWAELMSFSKGRLTQFYDTYMDAYTDDPIVQFAMPPSPQFHPQPQKQEQDKQPLPAWTPSVLSPVIASSHTNLNTNSPSRAANARMNQSTGVNMETDGNAGVHLHTGIGKSSGSGMVRRKPSRVPGIRRGMVYETRDDEGFVAGNYDVFEMANIRVKVRKETADATRVLKYCSCTTRAMCGE